MLHTSLNPEVLENKDEFLYLSSVNRMFIRPYGHFKRKVDSGTICTQSISIFNRINFYHSLQRKSIIDTQITDKKGRIHNVRIVTWSKSSDQIIGVVINRDDIRAEREINQAIESNTELM